MWADFGLSFWAASKSSSAPSTSRSITWNIQNLGWEKNSLHLGVSFFWSNKSGRDRLQEFRWKGNPTIDCEFRGVCVCWPLWWPCSREPIRPLGWTHGRNCSMSMPSWTALSGSTCSQHCKRRENTSHPAWLLLGNLALHSHGFPKTGTQEHKCVIVLQLTTENQAEIPQLHRPDAEYLKQRKRVQRLTTNNNCCRSSPAVSPLGWLVIQRCASLWWKRWCLEKLQQCHPSAGWWSPDLPELAGIL